MQLCHRSASGSTQIRKQAERENRDEPLVKKELGRTIDVDTKIAFRAVGIATALAIFFRFKDASQISSEGKCNLPFTQMRFSFRARVRLLG